MDIAAIIVNYRTPETAIEAAITLDAELQPWSHRILLVDNDSQDGSLARLRAAFPPDSHGGRIVVMDSGHNGGYGYGINVAVREMLGWAEPPRYVYILNPDAHADPGTMSQLISFMDGHPDAGLVGGAVHGPDGALQAKAFRFPSVWSELEGTAHLGPISRTLAGREIAVYPETSTEVDWVPGTGMLVRREVFATAGLFDQGFFLYFEEVDFARRVKAAGWKVYFVADARISHIGSLSTGMADETRPMPTYWFQARRRYFVKHHGRLYGAACDVAWLSGHALYLAKMRIKRGRSGARPRLWRDFARYTVRNLWQGPPAAEQNAHLPEPALAALPNGQATAAGDTRSASQMPFKEILREDLATYEGDLSSPGFWAVAVHRLGERIDRNRGTQRPVHRLMDLTYRALSTGVDWLWGIHLPRNVEVGRRVRLWHNGCMLLNARSIGNDVHIRHDTTFGPVFGRDPNNDDLPTIEEKADIGSGVCVLGNVRVGRESVIGANSVVLKHVPPQSTVIGIPARVVPK